MVRSLKAGRVLVVCVLLPSIGCASSNTLHEYDYRGRTVTVVSDAPPRPDVLTGPHFIGPLTGDPIRDIIRAGAKVAREVEARAVQDRLDEASARIDVGYVLEDNTLERAARYLAADAAAGEPDADYTLELIVVEYGIDAESWEATAYFFIEADATLLHTESGTEIWRAEVGARDPLGPEIWVGPSEVRDVATAITLSTLTVDEMVAVLEALADFSARAVTERLRDDLREARRR